MRQYDREEMIAALINKDMSLYESEGGYQYCIELLRDGFKGYENYCDAELLHECIESDIAGYN